MNPYIMAALAATAFSTGWMTKGWQYDSQTLATQTASEAAFIVALDAVNSISTKFQTSLDELDSKRVVTTKEIYHETTKQIYRDCVVPDAGRVLYNSATEAAETAATREP